MDKPAKLKINRLCGITALLCAAAMFVPIGEERGWFGDFRDSTCRGEAPYFIGHVVDAPAGGEVAPYWIGVLLVITASILLFVWAYNAFKGKASTGLAASISNLLLSAYTLMLCAERAFDGAAWMPVDIGLVVLAAAALVLAICQKKLCKQRTDP